MSIPGIPQSASGAILTNHINDRIRRINTALATLQGSTGKTGAAGPPGASSSGSGSDAAAFTIGISGGAGKPDLSRSRVQHMVLAVATNLVVPANRPAGKSMGWVLYVDNPTAGALTLTPDATYAIATLMRVAAGTRLIVACWTTQGGNTAAESMSFNQPILPI